MLVELVAFLVFALLLAALTWWSWSQRELARKQAAMNEELADLGRNVSDMAHDLNSILNTISVNVTVARDLPEEERVEALDDVENATWSAARLVQSMRPKDLQEAGQVETETILGLHVALLRRVGVPIEAEVTGDLPHSGLDVDAERVVQNLLANAVREAQTRDDGWVRVQCSAAGLFVSNPVRDPSTIDASIWERDVSRSGSSGAGLWIVRNAAEQAGWDVDFTVSGDVITFAVTPAATEKARSESGLHALDGSPHDAAAS